MPTVSAHVFAIEVFLHMQAAWPHRTPRLVRVSCKTKDTKETQLGLVSRVCRVTAIASTLVCLCSLRPHVRVFFKRDRQTPILSHGDIAFLSLARKLPWTHLSRSLPPHTTSPKRPSLLPVTSITSLAIPHFSLFECIILPNSLL